MNTTLKKNPPLNRRQQGGFTLVELAIVLVISGVLLSSSWSTISGKLDEFFAESFAGELNNSMSSFKKSRQKLNVPSSTRYAGATFNAATGRSMTENVRMSIVGNQVQWDNGVVITLGPSNATGGTGNSNSMLTLTNLTLIQCAAFVTTMAPASRAILSGTAGNTILRNIATSDTLDAADTDAICAADSATNSFRAVY